jgi:hypothetical protein
MPTSFRVIGYVTGIIVKAVEGGVVYLLSLTSLTGEEFVVRLRRPPNGSLSAHLSREHL